jgi:hypothetical protein
MDKSQAFKILYLFLTSLLMLFLAFILINILELMYIGQDFDYSLPIYLKIIIFGLSLLLGVFLGKAWFKKVYENTL